MDITMNSPISIFEDNQAAIKYCYSHEKAGRMRHVDVRFHWIRERLNSRSITLDYISTHDNPADIFTKTLKGEKLQKHTQSLGLRCH